MSTEHFTAGRTDGTGSGYNPVGVPVSNTDASGLLLPSAQRDVEQDPNAPVATGRIRQAATQTNPVYGMIREAERLRTKSGASNSPKVVKLHDAISIAKKMGTALLTLHQDLHKSGLLHSGLSEARKHLLGDPTLPADHPNAAGALQHLQSAELFAPKSGAEKVTHYDKAGNELTSTDDLAWEQANRGAAKLVAAGKALAKVSPERMADVVVHHTIEGHDFSFTPDKGFENLTKSNTAFKTTTKKPKTVLVGGKKVSATAVRAAITRDAAVKEQGMSGTDTLREEVVQEAKQAIKPKKRVRKSVGTVSAETSMFNKKNRKPEVSVEPLGKGATDSNKPKKQFRDEAPTETKAVRNVSKQGK